MRRKDREIRKLDHIFSVVENCTVVHLAMVDDGKPYVVALNFGFDRRGDRLILYLHSAQEGKKIDILRKNPSVYFQMDCANELIRGTHENPCGYSWRFDSVMGSGQAEFITDTAEKNHGLNRIIQHLDKTAKHFELPAEKLSAACILRIVSDDITGKHHE